MENRREGCSLSGRGRLFPEDEATSLRKVGGRACEMGEPIWYRKEQQGSPAGAGRRDAKPEKQPGRLASMLALDLQSTLVGLSF